MSNLYNDQENNRFRQLLTLRNSGTTTGRFSSKTSNITEVQKPKVDPQKDMIERQRKSKAIMRRNKAQFYGYCVDGIQLG